MAQEKAQANRPKRSRNHPPQPPAVDDLPLINGSDEIGRWLDHYWHKLRIPPEQAQYLAVTIDRDEFAHWTGRRLNPLALGCYCYLPIPPEGEGMVAAGELDYSDAARSTRIAPTVSADRRQLRLPGFNVLDDEETLPPLEDPIEARDLAEDYRHLIFIEPGMTDVGIEVTVAHELIHLSDRVQGRPRRHHCHGNDAISVDEAVVTGRDPEYLREQLRDETERREAVLREKRPYRFVYTCPNCGCEYPRVHMYKRTISCGHCDDKYNPAFELEVRELAKGERYVPKPVSASDEVASKKQP